MCPSSNFNTNMDVAARKFQFDLPLGVGWGSAPPPFTLGCSPMAEFLVGKGFLGLRVGKPNIFDFFSDFFFMCPSSKFNTDMDIAARKFQFDLPLGGLQPPSPPGLFAYGRIFGWERFFRVEWRKTDYFRFFSRFFLCVLLQS